MSFCQENKGLHFKRDEGINMCSNEDCECSMLQEEAKRYHYEEYHSDGLDCECDFEVDGD